MHTKAKQVYLPYKLRLLEGGSNLGRFAWSFLELQIPMGLGALVCYLVVRLISGSSSFTTIYRPGTFLFALGDIFFLTVPVAVWMIFRGHGWRHSLQLPVAMIAPVAAIMVLGQVARYAYLTWLLTGGYPVMSLGMLVYMLYRWNYFTSRRVTWRKSKRYGQYFEL